VWKTGKPFSDYELICEIQVKNELDLGENYRNINGCKTFAASIAQTLVDKQVDQRKFSSQKYELKHRWLYYSHSNNDYMCKFCELFKIYILICYVVLTLLM
jgi:hypothetical protein